MPTCKFCQQETSGEPCETLADAREDCDFVPLPTEAQILEAREIRARAAKQVLGNSHSVGEQLAVIDPS